MTQEPELTFIPYFHEGLVPLDRTTAILRRYEIHAVINGCQVVLDIETQDDCSSRCLSVKIEAPEGDGAAAPGVTTEVLQKVPVAKLIRLSRESRLITMSPGGEANLSVSLPEDPYGLRHRELVPGKPLSDEHLRAVADQYRAAVKAGRPPTATIRRVAGVGKPTASKWVREARRRKFLEETG